MVNVAYLYETNIELIILVWLLSFHSYLVFKHHFSFIDGINGCFYCMCINAIMKIRQLTIVENSTKFGLNKAKVHDANIIR